jgi:hypothetical protein
MNEKTSDYLPREGYFDPNDFYQNELISWRELWNADKTHYENLKQNYIEECGLSPINELKILPRTKKKKPNFNSTT